MNQSNPYYIPDEIRAIIQGKLDDIERQKDVRILFAIESGSRAWGFPSPDSDYDVRFLYVRKREWYLRLTEGRDVIELPIENDLDINGWDLKKALLLLLKPNPVLLEWMRSPIVYRSDENVMQQLKLLGEKVNHMRPSLHHYLHLGKTQFQRFIEGKDNVPVKKYFYALRPVLALMWLRLHPKSPLPMSFIDLRAGLNLPQHISKFLDELIDKKAQTRELGDGPRQPHLDALIQDEIARAEQLLKASTERSEQLLEEANKLFLEIVQS